MKFNLSKKEYLLLLLFASFTILRIFSQSEYHFISSDEGKYLTLARHFPYHTLDNKSLFLLHPPIFPYVIHFFSLFMKDYIAGITVSIIASLLTFILIYKLLSLYVKNFYVILGTLLLYAISVEAIFWSQKEYKELFMLALFLSSIYYFIKGITQDKKYLIYASIFGAITALTTDHVIFLIPSFISAIIILRNRKTASALHAAIPILVTLLFYSFWLYVRFNVYTHNDYYSTGIDGIVEKVNDFGIKQVLNPVFFSETSIYGRFRPSDARHYSFVLGYMFNNIMLPIPLGLKMDTFMALFQNNIIYAKIIFYMVLFLLFLYSIFKITTDFFKQRKIMNNYNLFFLSIFLIFLFPATQQSSSFRMIMMAAVFLFYFISLGFSMAFRHHDKLIAIFVILLAVFMPFWIIWHPHLIFNQKLLAEAEKTSAFLKSQPKDGIMSQIGYSPELNYLTGKRIISMPTSTANLDFLLKRFGINYLVYGQRYWKPVSEENKDEVFNYDVIKYIQQNPNRFKLIGVFKEDLKGVVNDDEMHVYEVLN